MKTSPAALGLLLLAAALAAGPGCSRESKLQQAQKRADAALKSGNLEAARLEYQNVLQLDPANVAAMERLGHIWLERGAPMRALPFLFQTGKLDPANRDVQLRLLSLLLDAGKLADARSGALTILGQHPRSDTALRLVAEAVKGSADYDAALRAWKEFPDQSSAGYHLAAAHLALYRGDTEAARAALLRAAGAQPPSAEAHTATALLHLKQRNPAAAGKSLQTAATLSPPRSLARLRWIEFRRQAEPAAALAELEALLTQAPDYFPAWCLRAQFAAAEKKPDEALAHLGRVFAVDPANFEARLVRAQLQLARGEIAPATEDLGRLADEFPMLPAPPFMLAQAHLLAKNPEKAQEALQRALAQNPDHDQAIVAWVQLSLQRREFDAVAKAMAALLARRPFFSAAQGFFLDALAGLGRYDDIVRLLEESVRRQPGQPQVHHLLGVVALRQQKTAEARRHFEETLKLAPDAFPAFAEIVRLDLRAGAAKEAAANVEPMLAKQPAHGPLQLLAATVFAQQGRWADTETAARKALDLGGGDAVAAYELLGRSIDATRPKAGVLAWLDGLQPKPEDKPAALITTGALLHRHGEFARARDAYEQCLALQPNAVPALNNLAVLYVDRLGNLDRALELAERARQLMPSLPEVADTLGWILLKRGDHARALDLLKEAAAKLPDDPSVRLHLARAHHLLGQAEPARAAYRAAAAAPGDFDGKTEIAGWLAELDRAP